MGKQGINVWVRVIDSTVRSFIVSLNLYSTCMFDKCTCMIDKYQLSMIY